MKIRFVYSTIALVLLAAAAGCWNGSGVVGIVSIDFDPAAPIKTNTDETLTANATGSGLTYHWTVSAGSLRKAESRMVQTRRLPKIAVTPAALDDFGRILAVNGLQYDNQPISMLGDASTLANYNVLFVNSSDDISVVGTEDVLKSWVDAGGALYTSGRGASIVSTVWPEEITFARPEPYVGSANESGEFVQGKIVSLAAALAIGAGDVQIGFQGNDWAPILGTASDVRTIATADVSTIVNKDAIGNLTGFENFASMPIAITFNSGNGMVMYTDFHYWFGQSPDERSILKQLAAIMTTTQLATQSHSLVDTGGYIKHADIADLLSLDGHKSYDFNLPSLPGLACVINSADGQFQLSIAGPDGIGDQVSGITPMTVTFPTASAGAWTANVDCTDDGGNDSVPFLLTIATQLTSLQLITTSPSVTWRTPLIAGTYTLTLKVIDENGKTAEKSADIAVE